MPTFPRGFANYQTHAANAKLLVSLARDAGGNIADERARQVYMMSPQELRGLPAVGRGVGGHIAGTKPGVFK